MLDLQPNSELQSKIGEAGSFIKSDVSDYDSQAKAFQGAWDRYGRLDLVVLNAGITDRRRSDV
ncbi:hypothetical protein CMQ_911 [Grosmannia clavigera kw1407]|uniref:Short chain dehydrogenase reductase n=1 Tax=Grosmannia clavigera (strain kw1407 / UAMH 11150) TaxID=655863 RepID=F0XES7_GROCL|nr:uncharacterized protein CMQ_911 [Grosmannia clavigera kw1407]EFX03983.1 hypothetical protein CMQ_911 [Grosmannia clavigera kw1407]